MIRALDRFRRHDDVPAGHLCPRRPARSGHRVQSAWSRPTQRHQHRRLVHGHRGGSSCRQLAVRARLATPANSESSLITALVVALIMAPVAPTDIRGLGALAFVSIWAVASKFIIATGGKHIFNPAALGVALTAVLLDAPATWWVAGNLTLMPAVLIGGFLIVRKLKRADSTLLFIAVNLATTLLATAPGHYTMALRETLLYSPVIFFATVMLTEPLTAPVRRLPRLVFAAIVGFLASPSIHLAGFYFTPETALLVGNVFAFAVGRSRATSVRIVSNDLLFIAFIYRVFKPATRASTSLRNRAFWLATSSSIPRAVSVRRCCRHVTTSSVLNCECAAR